MDGDFEARIGRTENTIDPAHPVQAQAAQAVLDGPGPALDASDALRCGTGSTFCRAPEAALDSERHPQRGGSLAPIPRPRRRFAGAHPPWQQLLVFGTPAERKACIREAVSKSGKKGSLALLTVGLSFMQNGALSVEEEQDIVQQEPGGPVAAPFAAPWPPLPEVSWTRVLRPDDRLLLRCSSLTFNAHRIHCDRGCARETEGHPGRVVHGPLPAVSPAQRVRRSLARPMRACGCRGTAVRAGPGAAGGQSGRRRGRASGAEA